MIGYEIPMMDYQAGRGRPDRGEQAVHAALKLYRNAQARAWLGKVWAALTGRSRRLLHLGAIRGACTVSRSYHAGTRAVPICQIRGSEDRCEDFDTDFQPLQPHNKSRWMSIATAQQVGATLPPVKLVQVGDIYFVRDGHHRISVAKSMGQEHIDAEVTVWEVAGPLPWKRQVSPVDQLAVQPA
jgi:hypothetical protein